MSDDERHRGIPPLTAVNNDQWFLQMEITLRGKGVFYVTEKTKEDFAKLLLAPDQESTTITSGTLNKEKKEMYEMAEGKLSCTSFGETA